MGEVGPGPLRERGLLAETWLRCNRPRCQAKQRDPLGASYDHTTPIPQRLAGSLHAIASPGPYGQAGRCFRGTPCSDPVGLSGRLRPPEPTASPPAFRPGLHFRPRPCDGQPNRSFLHVAIRNCRKPQTLMRFGSNIGIGVTLQERGEADLPGRPQAATASTLSAYRFGPCVSAPGNPEICRLWGYRDRAARRPNVQWSIAGQPCKKRSVIRQGTRAHSQSVSGNRLATDFFQHTTFPESVEQGRCDPHPVDGVPSLWPQKVRRAANGSRATRASTRPAAVMRGRSRVTGPG
jgi:hypothetical protein